MNNTAGLCNSANGRREVAAYRPAHGFTLVEVMVALAIVAIALPAVLVALYQQIDNTAYLRDKTLASAVAANALEEFRLEVAAKRNLSAGKSSGETRMAERDWFWWRDTTATEVAKFFRVEIAVANEVDGQSQPLYRLVAFMSGDLQIDLNPRQPSLSEGNGGGGSESEGASSGATPENPETPPESATPQNPQLPPFSAEELERLRRGR